MKFNSLVPELMVSDFEKTRTFYMLLGFTVRYERIENKFVFIELEGNQIMIQQADHQTDCWNTGKLIYPFGRGINLEMEVVNVDKIYEKVIQNKIPLFRDIKVRHYRQVEKVWKNKEFLIQDPDGYLLRFCSVLN
ncbi:MAG: VOC family protein [Christensenellaceae bacterium]|jgi:extradiol dioxygenase family protein|nr:VOC family protein [Christensenellaceae bacterium]